MHAISSYRCNRPTHAHAHAHAHTDRTHLYNTLRRTQLARIVITTSILQLIQLNISHIIGPYYNWYTKSHGQATDKNAVSDNLSTVLQFVSHQRTAEHKQESTDGNVNSAGSATYQICFRLPIPNPNPKPLPGTGKETHMDIPVF